MADKKEEESTESKRALLIVDVQYDFCPPDGSLKVGDGEKIIPVINDIRKEYKFDLVCLSMDWHPPNHISFLTNNKDRDSSAELFKEAKLPNGSMQVMWPDHCVQGSNGAKIHKELTTQSTDKIVMKGLDPAVDSYSAFMDNDKKTKTALNGLLQEANITDVYCVGLAFDFCVGNTALDAKALGYKNVYIVDPASKSVAPESEKTMRESCKEKGVEIVDLEKLKELLK
mmetsp:Transcript_58103/g.96338  ORF Transcript_58103/g.96338 Transcript_58103/m.96338 type:complete len:228 (+) Transcript_58103:99-782(+)|eukprot:CAMPEP_0202708358 /NCGR_PEP_ID=MMETSP1385-20130828/20588_1 /ASSEMBLY_ACC=CAM_ASM_000861 /TAXON_ID=933848 /ORGANISM="Elphidium margaritaceum" /LENGTH=227 /DNA_ID=CAMNT_0049367317 /DNA_START=89 /DNA_END=772 /DNA_ORIENTATION=+